MVTCAALYKAFSFCKQEMKRYLAQLEKGQVGERTDTIRWMQAAMPFLIDG